MRADAERLLALYDQRIALTRELSQQSLPTRVMAQAVLDKGAELDTACEHFRRRHFPRRHRVMVGCRQVFAVSRTGRSVTLILDGFGGTTTARTA